MKNRALHENLDTSFVNLAALVRYLRRRQFAGHIRVELSGYEADIHLAEKNQIRAREYDHIAGRVAEGEEALQRILIRSREPGGIINVYQDIPENEAVNVEKENVEEKKNDTTLAAPPAVKAKPVSTNGNGNLKSVQNTKTNGNSAPTTTTQNGNNGNHSKPSSDKQQPQQPTSLKPNLPKLPFELSNRVEDKARQINLSGGDREMLLKLTCELLKTIDDTLAAANLNFTAAFQKACAEVAQDYPFLNPKSSTGFVYQNGRVAMREPIMNAKIFVAGINETLRRILEKLGAHPKFSQIYRATVQKLLALIRQRKPLYDRFSITPQLEKILGA